MFIGRQEELEALNAIAAEPGFQMVTVYGRRRIGKTTLIEEFLKDRPSFYYMAQEQAPKDALASFSAELYQAFDASPHAGPFASWKDAFLWLADQIEDPSDRFVVVLDEFPYLASSDASVQSALQLAIDRQLIRANVLVILAGSNQGFMESKVLGEKNPLFGRWNHPMRIEPLDYLDAARLAGGETPEQALAYYGVLGGTPYYLAQVQPELDLLGNIQHLFLSKYASLYQEPLFLLKEELREPGTYSSVLSALAHGATQNKEIADKASNGASLSRYLDTLKGLGIVQRSVPFGEPETSKNSLWSIADPFFSFWYRFVQPSVPAIERGVGRAALRRIDSEQLDTYLGGVFESVAMQWLVRENAADRLPFLADEFGRWWGTDPVAREQCDIDVVIGDSFTGQAIIGECKWRNSFNETQAMRDLERRSHLIKGHEVTGLYLFTKHPVSNATRVKMEADGRFRNISADALFGL